MLSDRTTIVSGSRTITDYELFKRFMAECPFLDQITTVFFGDAKGVDAMILRWCKENGRTYQKFKAEWNIYGKGAGPVRNQEMIQAGADSACILWTGARSTSPGSADMLRRVEEHQLLRHVRVVRDGELTLPGGKIVRV